MPGHFLVRDPADPNRLIDCFAEGRRLDHAGCYDLLRRIRGANVALTPEFFATTGPRGILARILKNLHRSFERRGDLHSLAWVTRLHMALPDLPLQDRIQIAQRAVGFGWYDRAADILDEVAAEPTLPASTSDHFRRQSLRLRSSLN
jgi:regulator of sirC expression with transglutaminase-like and TPR domain